MTATTFHPRRPGSPVPRRRTTTLPPRRPSTGEDDSRLAEMARMEAAAIEAGRWLRRTGRVSLPVRHARARHGGRVTQPEPR